jgi:DNA invertase Pin-like site-specific DNA recombinase
MQSKLYPLNSFALGADFDIVGRMQTVYSYVRFSSPAQAEGDSLRRQTTAAEEYCKKHGWTLDTSLDLRDLGVSAFRGKNATERKLAAFIAAIDSGRAQPGSILLLESLDRLSRQQVEDALELFLGIIRRGIEIHTLCDGYIYKKGHLDIPKLVISLFILARANEESERKADRLRKVWGDKKANASNGKAITKCTPRWLEAETGKPIKVIPERGEAVRKIFSLATLGFGARRIANQLAADGVPAFGGSGWTISYIKKILHNRAVLGEFQAYKLTPDGRAPDGDAVSGYYPAIVSQTEWNSAHAAIQRKLGPISDKGGRYRGGSRPSDRVNNLFSGLVFDSTLGRPLTYHYKGRGANDWEYLVTAYKAGQPSHKMRYDHFEKAFLAFLGDLDWRAVSDEAEPAELKALTDRLNDVRSELDRTERAIARNQKLIDSAEEVPLSLFSAQDKAQARLIELQAEGSRLEAEAERIKFRSSVIDRPEELLAAIQSRDGSNDTRLRLRAEIRRRVSRIDVSFGAEIITSTGEPILNVQPGLANVLIWITFTNGITRIVVFQGENKVLLS